MRAADREASARFYETVFAAAEIEPRDFSVEAAGTEPPTQRLHIGFGVAGREQVDAFWRAGVDAGYESDGEPGERQQYTEGYYGAFLLDPDGNSAEAVHHPGVRTDGHVDHLWF